jgi:heme-degrading monooxygenase HmoA
MHVIMWEFEVHPDRRSEFVAAYSANGAWVQLFRQAKGYLGTELLSSTSGPARYVTIDRWNTVEDFKRFQAEFAGSYRALDAVCESLTMTEREIGTFWPAS